jgi:uncharacterized membrane protein
MKEVENDSEFLYRKKWFLAALTIIFLFAKQSAINCMLLKAKRKVRIAGMFAPAPTVQCSTCKRTIQASISLGLRLYDLLLES